MWNMFWGFDLSIQKSGCLQILDSNYATFVECATCNNDENNDNDKFNNISPTYVWMVVRLYMSALR